jgi:DNA repair exonuclease SbcCD ATPase subunit
MIKYIEAIEGLPIEIKLPLMKAFELFREEIAETVKRSDFEGLKAVVQELAEAQKRTEQRVEELAEAQKRTEQRVEELAEAQRRTEQRVEELAEAQRRTEQRVEELAEAQRRTEESLESFKKTTEENFNRVWKAIDELAEAQKRTEESLNRLIKRVDIIEERLEGISNSVGYSLENTAYRALPGLLRKEGILVSGRLIRRYWEENQINIWGRGKKRGKDIVLLGESKVRPSKKEIDRFIKIAEEIKKKERTETYLLFVAHDYPPAIEGYLKEKKIKYYWSYELEA